MDAGYRVKTVVLSSGERLPVLLDREGRPMFGPTVFVLTEVRGRNRAANTIAIVLRSVMAFYLFLDRRGIDLEARLNAGELLSLGEVEDLVRLCRLPISELAAFASRGSCPHPKVSSLEQVRMRPTGDAPAEVDSDVAASRLRYIRTYLEWLASERQSRHPIGAMAAVHLAESSRRVTEAINARIPRRSRLNLLQQREGASGEAVAELLRVIDPQAADNPWRDPHARYRNAVIIHWLLFLGVRIGELLGVRVSDIVVYDKEVTIRRRADDPDDPRREQPQAKTRERVLPLSDALLAETQAYILKYRSAFPGARKHPFLFVASRTGRPLTLVALGKVVSRLRERCPSLPKELTAHVLRHTWNDAFSKKMEEAGIAPESEVKARSYLMGWSPTSATALTYTRRYVRNRAKAVSLELQSQLITRGKRGG